MRIVSIDKDGNVVVEMSAAEAKDVRTDIGQQPASDVSLSGDKLHSLLEWATPVKRS
ncbi:hypothetical protein ACWGNN_00965 [Streptomyces sp. NPDC055817]